MPDLTVTAIQWLFNQGVAIAVLVLVLYRFDKQLSAIANSLQELVDALPRRKSGRLVPPRGAHRPDRVTK